MFIQGELTHSNVSLHKLSKDCFGYRGVVNNEWAELHLKL